MEWNCRCAPISASIPSRFRSSAFPSLPCRCRSNRCRSAYRSSQRAGAKTLRCASRMHWSASAWSPHPRRGEFEMDIELPEGIAQVTAALESYETPLITNDVAGLDELFRNDPRTLRYGIGENLYGYGAIAGFRAARSPVGLNRRTAKTVITTYGRDTAVAATLFYRDTLPGKVGRQMQTWVRFPEGWRVVAAHVSIIDEPKDT